jgi:hypothetical protein
MRANKEMPNQILVAGDLQMSGDGMIATKMAP